MKERIRELIQCGFCWLTAACMSVYLVALGFIVLDLELTNGSFLLLVILGVCWLFLMGKFGAKRIGNVAKTLTVVCVSLTLLLWSGWWVFSRNAVYENPDTGKSALYSGRKVMVIVPHQDDDLNLLGGVLEEYVSYGSEVYVVFTTNGDFTKIAHTRYREAEAVLGEIGIPSDHVIFLGYGDQWKYGYPHLYNAKPGEVIPSVAGRTQTYGMEFHPAYREGRDYTVENFREDLKSVILEYKPDVIFCSDYDPHIDHKAWSLMFDKVMGDILKGKTDYRPAVYKGFCYASAWTAPMDYYGENMAATSWFSLKGTTYRWEDRVRLPVKAGTLSRSLLSAPGFTSLKGYFSQGAHQFAGKIINGDRLVWPRDTNSLCLQANVQVSSGEGGILNDFMRLENDDLRDESRAANDGVWIPQTTDPVKTVTITFQEPAAIDRVVLYDNPSELHNITDVEIHFDDGSCIEKIALDPVGAATEIPVGKENVTFFEIRIRSAEGELAGLTEIEAFSQPRTPAWKFLKLMDEQGDFVYDYWVREEGKAEFALYTQGLSESVQWEKPVLSLSNDRCSAAWENGKVVVDCPRGEETILTVSVESGAVSDSVVLRNPGGILRGVTRFFQGVEDRVVDLYYGFRDGMWEQVPSAVWVMEKWHMLSYYIMKYLF